MDKLQEHAARYDYILDEYPDDVPVAVAAKLLGKSPSWVQFGLESQSLPFGTYIKKGRCSFHIAPLALVRYLQGDYMMPSREIIDAQAKATAREMLISFHKELRKEATQ